MTLSELAKLLAGYDFQGLIRLGAPSNEYAGEAEIILARLPNCRSVVDVRRVVYVTFCEQFHPMACGDEANYQAVASVIAQLHGL